MFTIQDLALDEVIPAYILLYANNYAAKATLSVWMLLGPVWIMIKSLSYRLIGCLNFCALLIMKEGIVEYNRLG